MSGNGVPGGVVHKLPADLRNALIANPTALDAWKDITPLARNEFICWVEDAKQEMTRERRIRRTKEELEEGQRRPCCWPGCAHRERIRQAVASWQMMVRNDQVDSSAAGSFGGGEGSDSGVDADDQVDAISARQMAASDARMNETFGRLRRRLTMIVALAVGMGLLLGGFTVWRTLRLEQELEQRYREVLHAQEILQEKYHVAADVWSVTSYKALYSDGIETERWNLLHPIDKPRVPYVSECLAEAPGVLVAATDYLKALPNMVSQWMPRRLASLGTDGFGRSESRQSLRNFFEVDARFITLATLHELLREGKIQASVVQQAIKDLEIDVEKADPLTT